MDDRTETETSVIGGEVNEDGAEQPYIGEERT